MNTYVQKMIRYGWVRLSRLLLDHWIWNADKPFSEGQAWIDLLLNANYKNTVYNIKNQIIKVGVGQQVRSQLTLAEAWGWQRSHVRAFLTRLCKAEMISTQRDGRFTIITICNYEQYQNNVEIEEEKLPINDPDHFSINTQIVPNDNLFTDQHSALVKEVKNKRSKEEKIKKSFLKGEMQLDAQSPENTDRKARAAQKIICKFFFEHLDENKLQRIWNELGLTQVAEISNPVKQQAYLRYRDFIERYHGDDVFSPLVDNLELNENAERDEDSYQSSFTESQLLTFMPAPTFWVCSYLVNSFQNYITEYHRGKNPNQWVADIDFAFNRETYRKVTDKDGEDFHYMINDIPFIRGIKNNE